MNQNDQSVITNNEFYVIKYEIYVFILLSIHQIPNEILFIKWDFGFGVIYNNY